MNRLQLQQLLEGKEHSWKSEGHYTKDGKEWAGPQHAHNGQVMTGEKHTADSQNLYHYKELSKEAQDKVEKMDEGIVDTVMKSKTLNSKNYKLAATELEKRMKNDPKKSRTSHAFDISKYHKNVDPRKLAAEEMTPQQKADRLKAMIQAGKNRDAEKKDEKVGKEQPTQHLKNMQKKERENIAFHNKHTPGKKFIQPVGRKDGQKAPKKARSYTKSDYAADQFSRHDYAEVDYTKGCPLLEMLNPDDGIGKYIKDFSKSDAPQFKGKSSTKRRQMAVASYLGQKRKRNEKA